MKDQVVSPLPLSLSFCTHGWSVDKNVKDSQNAVGQQTRTVVENGWALDTPLHSSSSLSLSSLFRASLSLLFVNSVEFADSRADEEGDVVDDALDDLGRGFSAAVASILGHE